MRNPSSSLLADLGLQPDAVALEASPLPKAGVALGLTQQETRSAQQLFDLAPALELALTQLAGRARVQASRIDPRVLLIESAGEATRRTGQVTQPEKGLWFVDARLGPAGVVFDDEIGVLVEQDVLFVIPAKSPVSEMVEAWQPQVSAAPAVSLDDVLQGASLPDWLRLASSSRIDTPSAYLRAAGVGLVGRLWTPERGPEAFARAVGGQSPMDGALAWFRGLSPIQRSTVGAEALGEAAELAADLEKIPSLLEQPSALESLVHLLAVRRDDLESVAFLSGPEHRNSELGELLNVIDSEASNWNTLWSSLFLADDERLSAVAWQEPDHWWGTLGLSR